jgi:hypothetical protein
MSESEQSIASTATVGSGAQLIGSVVIRDHAVVDDGAIIGAAPDSTPNTAATTVIGEGAFVGARAIVGAGVSIGSGAVLRPGSVLTADAPPMAVVSGNPGAVIDYVASPAAPVPTMEIGTLASDGGSWLPKGVSFVNLQQVSDLRGDLVICEHEDLPFTVNRTFFVTDVERGLFRGAHAHEVCIQMLVCVQGSVSCLLDDKEVKLNVSLNRPDIGLVVPPLIWVMQYNFSPGSVLAVYASHRYTPDEYINSYEDFVSRD